MMMWMKLLRGQIITNMDLEQELSAKIYNNPIISSKDSKQELSIKIVIVSLLQTHRLGAIKIQE